MIFYDTSVLVAAALQSHPRHEESAGVLPKTGSATAGVAAHSLVEIYSVLIRLPPAYRMQPEAALAVVEQIQEEMTVVTLTTKEQIEAIRGFAARNLRGGVVYDGMIVECARKAQAKRIYTLNGRHFRMIAPDLAAMIVEPE